jgi:hypothetical protein
LKSEGWEDQTVQAIVLDNGTLLYPSRDYEGNSGGALFGFERTTKKHFGI